jgi:hypothetical protein
MLLGDLLQAVRESAGRFADFPVVRVGKGRGGKADRSYRFQDGGVLLRIRVEAVDEHDQRQLRRGGRGRLPVFVKHQTVASLVLFVPNTAAQPAAEAVVGGFADDLPRGGEDFALFAQPSFRGGVVRMSGGGKPERESRDGEGQSQKRGRNHSLLGSERDGAAGDRLSVKSANSSGMLRR